MLVLSFFESLAYDSRKVTRMISLLDHVLALTLLFTRLMSFSLYPPVFLLT